MQGFSDDPVSEDSKEECIEEASLDIKPSSFLLILHLRSLNKDQFSNSYHRSLE